MVPHILWGKNVKLFTLWFPKRQGTDEIASGMREACAGGIVLKDTTNLPHTHTHWGNKAFEDSWSQEINK